MGCFAQVGCEPGAPAAPGHFCSSSGGARGAPTSAQQQRPKGVNLFTGGCSYKGLPAGFWAAARAGAGKSAWVRREKRDAQHRLVNRAACLAKRPAGRVAGAAWSCGGCLYTFSTDFESHARSAAACGAGSASPAKWSNTNTGKKSSQTFDRWAVGYNLVVLKKL
jgi:hypothetical protein